MVDAYERLQVLLNQEATTYRTSDYLTRMQAQSASTGVDRAQDTGESAPESPNKKRRSSLLKPEDMQGELPPPGQEALGAGCAGDASSSSQINKYWREKICEWAYQVVDHFDLHREVVCIAMNHLDRYLATYPDSIDKNTFQLLAMTCLYLSVKLNEYNNLLIPGSKSSMETILQLSRGYFTLDQMKKMEFEVLNKLKWLIHPPTPQVFVKHFLAFLSVEEHEIHDLSQFLVELSVMDYFFVSYKPSEIAIAAVLIAVDRLKPHCNILCNFPFNHSLINIGSAKVSACRDRLNLIFSQANDQAHTEFGHSSPKESINRTTSPVSVMAPPQPVEAAVQHMDYSMVVEYSDDEDL